MRHPRSLFLIAAALVVGCSSSPEPAESDESNPTPAAITSPADMNAQIDSMMEPGRFRTEAWRADLSFLAQSPTRDRCLQVEGDLLLVQDDGNTVHAINLMTGVHRWVVAMSGGLTQPVGRGDGSCVMVSDDRMIAVDDDTGARLMSRIELELDFWPWSAGAMAGGVAFAGTAAPYGLQAVSADTGLSGWHYATKGAISDVKTHGSGSTSQVICGTEDGLILSLPPWSAGGKAPSSENWFRRLPAARLATPMVVQDGMIVVGADDTFVYCLEAATGLIRWKSGCDAPVNGPAPLVADGHIYVRASNSLFAFDAETGATLWQNDAAIRAITRIGDRCYLDMGGNEVAVVDCESGEEVSRFSSDGLNLPTVPGGGVLVAGDGDGHLFALK